MKNIEIVVTGIGPLSSLGIGKKETWDNLLKANPYPSVEQFYRDDKIVEDFFVHKINSFDLSKFNLDKQKINEIRIWKNKDDVLDLSYFLASIKLALEDANVKDAYLPQEMGLILGHENPGINQFLFQIFNEAYDLLEKSKSSKYKFQQEIFKIGNRRVYDLQTFMFLYHVSKVFNIHGFSTFINNACCSGLYALEVAADAIKSKKCRAIIVAAADSPDFYKYLWFKNAKMCSKDGKIRPFSKNANGFVVGHGGAALLLENKNDAMKRGARIYAEYLGGNFFLESWKVAYPAVRENFYKNLLTDLLKKNKISPSQIDLVNPHGVGNKIIDFYEASAISKAFTDSIGNVSVSAFKPYVGHTLGASALLELLILILSLENDTILPILNFEKPQFFKGINFIHEIKKKKMNIVIKTCTAFAGFDGAVMLRKYRK